MKSFRRTAGLGGVKAWGLLRAVRGWHVLCRLSSDEDRSSVVRITLGLNLLRLVKLGTASFKLFFSDQ